MANLSITAARVAPVAIKEIISGAAKEAVTAGQYVRLNVTDGLIELGNGTNAAEARRGGLALRTVGAGDFVEALKKGEIDVGDALGDLTFDDDVYLSDTDGALADSAGTVSLVVGTVIPGRGHTTSDKLLRLDL